MTTNITELNTEELQGIQGGSPFASGSTIFYTAPLDSRLVGARKEGPLPGGETVFA
jgi:bacteriocin-like protein